jgi:hypothetical protein
VDPATERPKKGTKREATHSVHDNLLQTNEGKILSTRKRAVSSSLRAAVDVSTRTRRRGDARTPRRLRRKDRGRSGRSRGLTVDAEAQEDSAMWDSQRRERGNHAHRAEDVRAKSHDDPAARILCLQRSAGNQAVARWLLQRADVTGQITHGAERHHPKYSYTFQGDQQPRVYDLDAWFTKKQGQSPMDYAAGITPQTVTDLINGWDGSQSIIRAVRAALVGTAAWGAKTGAITGKHFTGQTQAGAITVNDNVAATAQGQLFAQHFLSLESNIDLRVDDLPKNAITALEVESKPKVGASTKKVFRPDWNKVLQEARLALKAKLLAGANAPGRTRSGWSAM